MINNTTICIDLAKTVFQVAVFNQFGKLKSNREVSEKIMCDIIRQHPAASIYMEACGTAHHWGRKFSSEGYSIGLIPPHIAAKYRLGNKNDKNDAVSIYEASKSTQLKCVQTRTLEQQDIALLHRHREGFKKERNQVANRIRGVAREYGINFPLGLKKLCQQVPWELDEPDNGLTVIGRTILRNLLDHLTHIIKCFDRVTKEIELVAKKVNACNRLMAIPGIGLLGSSMLYAKLGSGEAFSRGRDASASLGVVPSHSGSGGKVNIGRITKRGDVYLRSLLTNGARTVVMNIKNKEDSLSCWIRSLLARKNFNKTVIAVVNKLVRVALAMLKSGHEYHLPVARLEAVS